jgi:hypothetical protein
MKPASRAIVRQEVSLNAKYERTLEKVFAEPTPSNIKWRDIEAMLTSLGAAIGEGSGSRVRVELNGIVAVFHRPHPRPDTKRYAVRAVRDFLTAAGVRAVTNNE